MSRSATDFRDAAASHSAGGGDPEAAEVFDSPASLCLRLPGDPTHALLSRSLDPVGVPRLGVAPGALRGSCSGS